MLEFDTNLYTNKKRTKIICEEKFMTKAVVKNFNVNFKYRNLAWQRLQKREQTVWSKI
jgi:hypothetical protein